MGKGGGGGDQADVVGAARETGEQARRLNEAQTAANRPNQNNAWGSTEWSSTPTWDPTTGQYVNNWTQTETLAPAQQQMLDSQNRVAVGKNQLAEGAMARAWDDYSNPMDFDQYGDVIGFDPTANRQEATDAAYQMATNRLDPRFQSEQDSLLLRLRNQGLGPGDQAYDAAVSNFDKGKNDAYQQAQLASVGAGLNEFSANMQSNQLANALRSQSIDEGLFKRGFNLSEADQLAAGTQIVGGPPTSGGQTETIASKNLG